MLKDVLHCPEKRQREGRRRTNILPANRQLITFVSNQVIIGNIVLTRGLTINNRNEIPSGKVGACSRIACWPFGSVADSAHVEGRHGIGG